MAALKTIQLDYIAHVDEKKVRCSAYWNPMWECATNNEHRTASITGLSEPAAKGAMVRGIRPMETSLLSDECQCIHKKILHAAMVK